MDEPLSNLDAKLRVQMRAEIVKLQKRLRTTTIYVTHDQVEAMTMGDRIAVMNQGVLQQLDSPEILYDHPANLFVATFLGSPAMNIIRMRVSKGPDSVVIYQDPLQFEVPAQRVPQLSKFDGKEVLIGIRPEDFSLARIEGHTDAPSVKLNVELVELVGAEKLLHLSGPNGMTVLATIGARHDVHVGEAVELAVNTEHLHAFDVETEESIFYQSRVPA